MPSAPRDPGRLKLVLDIFTRDAEAGRVATTNMVLAGKLGLASISGPVPYIAELEARGEIRVERFHRTRRVTIVATGKQTALPKGAAPGRWSAPEVRPEPRPVAPPAPPALRQGPDGLQLVPPFVIFSAEEADAFDEALAEGWGIETAARMVGRLPLDGYRQFHRVCAELGEAPRPEIAASKNDPREAAAPRIRGQQGILA
jgi:hypothetical protein